MRANRVEKKDMSDRTVGKKYMIEVEDHGWTYGVRVYVSAGVRIGGRCENRGKG